MESSLLDILNKKFPKRTGPMPGFAVTTDDGGLRQGTYGEFAEAMSKSAEMMCVDEKMRA